MKRLDVLYPAKFFLWDNTRLSPPHCDRCFGRAKRQEGLFETLFPLHRFTQFDENLASEWVYLSLLRRIVTNTRTMTPILRSST